MCRVLNVEFDKSDKINGYSTSSVSLVFNSGFYKSDDIIGYSTSVYSTSTRNDK